MVIQIRDLREKKGMTANQLAELVGVTQPTISRLETGVRRPSIDTARKIAAALDCTIDELFGEKEEEQG